MTYYEKLEIRKYLGHEVHILLHKTYEHYVGVVRHGLTNEDWEEDGEPEALALCIDGQHDLEEIDLKDIKFISKASESSFMQEAS